MPNVIRVSVSEAARLFGVEPKTIRRAIKAETLKYIIVQGRYKINFNSLLDWSQGKTATKNKLADKGIGQYVDKWKIKNKLYSPSPELVPPPKKPKKINPES
ncbi:MAG: hypothetical protein CMI53_05105 [Parcubacteria group bacterium]|jgi:excisionase family DNA binding protein|nr:hypothetical protein [Parcubacteria group bacterium]|tara:strand:+ start:5620 stop:5925 length:306 start_codon:yes stop_codon:yes gene_type:complete